MVNNGRVLERTRIVYDGEDGYKDNPSRTINGQLDTKGLAWHSAAIADFGTLATNMEKYRTIQSCKNQIGLVALPRFLPI